MMKNLYPLESDLVIGKIVLLMVKIGFLIQADTSYLIFLFQRLIILLNGTEIFCSGLPVFIQRFIEQEGGVFSHFISCSNH